MSFSIHGGKRSLLCTTSSPPPFLPPPPHTSGPPSAPIITPISCTSSSLTITWTNPFECGSPISQYTLTTSPPSQDCNPTCYRSPDQRQATLSVQPNRTTTVSIRADNCGGNQAGQTGSSSYIIQGGHIQFTLCFSKHTHTHKYIHSYTHTHIYKPHTHTHTHTPTHKNIYCSNPMLFLSQANESVPDFNGIPVFNVYSEFAVGIRFSWSPLVCHTHNTHTHAHYGGPVGRGYEQRFESKNEYEQRSENKIAYGPRAKLRTVHEQNCVRSESKIAYGLRAKLRTVREQKRAGAESKNAYELRAVVYIGFRHYAICFFSLKKWLPDATLASSVCNFPKGC